MYNVKKRAHMSHAEIDAAMRGFIPQLAALQHELQRLQQIDQMRREIQQHQCMLAQHPQLHTQDFSGSEADDEADERHFELDDKDIVRQKLFTDMILPEEGGLQYSRLFNEGTICHAPLRPGMQLLMEDRYKTIVFTIHATLANQSSFATAEIFDHDREPGATDCCFPRRFDDTKIRDRLSVMITIVDYALFEKRKLGNTWTVNADSNFLVHGAHICLTHYDCSRIN